MPQALGIGIATTHQVEMAEDEIVPLENALEQSPKEGI